MHRRPNLRNPKCALGKNTSLCAQETNIPKQKFDFENSKLSLIISTIKPKTPLCSFLCIICAFSSSFSNCLKLQPIEIDPCLRGVYNLKHCCTWRKEKNSLSCPILFSYSVFFVLIFRECSSVAHSWSRKNTTF